MKTTIQRVYFVVLILFFCIIEQLNASSINTYFFAYGQEEEINIFWDYCGEENLLGCHLLRSETFDGEYLQVNDNLLTSPDTNFSFQDTTSIIDTLDYFYKISYIWPDSTFTEFFPIFSLKQITFEVINTNLVEVYLEMRKNITYGYGLYVSWDNIGWELADAGAITICDSMLIDPYNYPGNYFQMEFIDLELPNPDLGHFKLSMDYLISIIVGADINDEIIPESTNILYQNYPNPFNPETNISFQLEKESEIELNIYNIKGQLIREFKIQNSKFKINFIVWDGTDNYQNQVSSGVYLYRLKSDNFVSKTSRMLLLK